MAIEIVDFPIENGGSFHSYVTNYQRVTHQLPIELRDFQGPRLGRRPSAGRGHPGRRLPSRLRRLGLDGAGGGGGGVVQRSQRSQRSGHWVEEWMGETRGKMWKCNMVIYNYIYLINIWFIWFIWWYECCKDCKAELMYWIVYSCLHVLSEQFQNITWMNFAQKSCTWIMFSSWLAQVPKECSIDSRYHALKVDDIMNITVPNHSGWVSYPDDG